MEGDQRKMGQCQSRGQISIHALRVEGDTTRQLQFAIFVISIHALRVEGDRGLKYVAVPELHISIHALRVEGDAN